MRRPSWLRLRRGSRGPRGLLGLVDGPLRPMPLEHGRLECQGRPSGPRLGLRWGPGLPAQGVHTRPAFEEVVRVQLRRMQWAQLLWKWQ